MTTTYYVATQARYVLVEAADEQEARAKGTDALAALDQRGSIKIRTVRPASGEEIRLARWHEEMLSQYPKEV